MPVSYTHLDVYKRQTQPQLISSKNQTLALYRTRSSTDVFPLTSVSYTHLDVYKRQRLYSPLTVFAYSQFPMHTF